MKKIENPQTKDENKQIYIPMEVSEETITDFGISPEDGKCSKIGNRKMRAAMISAAKEQYYAYMRPLWCEDKREQRQEPLASLDKIYDETEFEATDESGLEDDTMKKSAIEEPHKTPDEHEELDRSVIETCGDNYNEQRSVKRLK